MHVRDLFLLFTLLCLCPHLDDFRRQVSPFLFRRYSSDTVFFWCWTKWTMKFFMSQIRNNHYNRFKSTNSFLVHFSMSMKMLKIENKTFLNNLGRSSFRLPTQVAGGEKKAAGWHTSTGSGVCAWWMDWGKLEKCVGHSQKHLTQLHGG